MTFSDLTDYSVNRNVIVQETKSSPSVKQAFFYYQEDESFTVVSQDERTKQRLSGAWDAVRDFLYSVFLPVGYPDTVSPDYLSWQLWNSLQDFSNTVTRTLATHAVLKGAGVGDAQATPLAATITWLMKDVTGMFGSIGFAYLKGSKFDCDHKKWRLFADVINDMGYMLDIMSPHMYFGFAFMQCSSSLVKALVGVAGGATRASLVQHQAKNNNMADIQAKDGSQETLTNLIALCFSLLLVPFVADSSHLVWTLYLIFTVIHLFANYKGVKSLKIPIFNLTRFGIAVRRFLRSEGSLSLHVINDLEPVWFFSGCSFENRLNLGMPLKAHVKDLKSLRLLCQIYSGDKYILTIDSKTKGINISFDEESDNMTTLTACFQAFLLIQALDHENVDDNGNLDFRVDSLIKLVPHDGREGERRIELLMQLLRQSKSLAHDMFPSFLKELHTQGWDLSRCLISQGDWKYWLTNKEQE